MLPNQRFLFDLPDGHAYLNCAYMSPQLKSVKKVAMEMLEKKSKPWKITIPDFYEPVKLLKERFAQLINAEDYQRIAIIPAVSYGMAAVANNVNLKAGDEVLIAEEQFPSNYYSWDRQCQQKGARIITVTAPDSQRRSEEWTSKFLEAINDRTAVVTMGHIHWADGSLFDLEAIRATCDRVGALLIIDGTQSIGALPFDVRKIRPDALICGGYKWLLGPYTCGVAYFGPAFDGGIPLEENWINRWNSEDFAGLVKYEANYQPGAGRYSMGEHSNFLLVPQLSEAIRQLVAWTPAAIQEYCAQISRNAIAELAELGCSVDQSAQRAHHLFGVRLSDQIDINDLKSNFANEQVYVSQRGNAIRISSHLYNLESEFGRLFSCFLKAAKPSVF